MTTPTDGPISVKSGRIRFARRLGRRGVRAEEGLFLAEGTKSLTEALGFAGHPDGGVVEVFATAAATVQHSGLRQTVSEAGVPWTLADDGAIAALSGAVTPQGVVAICRFVEVSLDSLLDSAAPRVTRPERGGSPDAQTDRLVEPQHQHARHPVAVICADVRDPGNAGTVIRCADAAGAQGVVLSGNSVDAYNDKTVRASVGSLWHLPIALGGDPADVVRRVRAAGFVVLAADGAGETSLFEAEASGLLDQPVAWLFGNEAWGLPDELAALADHRVSIPILGRAESLNLSTAAAVCLYASARTRSVSVS